MNVQQLNSFNITLNGSPEELGNLSLSLNELSQKFSISVDVKNQINLILEELYTNAVNYGLIDVLRPLVTIDFLMNDSQIEIIYRDNGIQYNPLEKLAPDLTLSIEERAIGGLGIFFVKSMTDFTEYHYDGKLNQIKMLKNLTVTAPK